MNQLTITRQLNLNFILKEHQEEFVEQVFKMYSNINNLDVPPSIGKNLFSPLFTNGREFFVAAMLTKEHKDDVFFMQQVEGMSKSEKFRFVKEQTDQYIMNENYTYDAWLYEDIREVLMYHRMSFGDVLDVTAEQIAHDDVYYCNLPNVKVW